MYLNGFEKKLAFLMIGVFSYLKVKVSKSTVLKEISFHPFFPSLHSISWMLKRYGFENIALTVNISKLHDLPRPFFLYTNYSIDFPIKFITGIEGDQIEYINEKKMLITDRIDRIIKDSNAAVILFEKQQEVEEKDYRKRTLKQLLQNSFIYVLAAISLLILLGRAMQIMWNGGASSSLIFLLFFVTNLTGFIFSILLARIEIGDLSNNSLLRKICGTGKKANCNAVLSSSGSKLLNLISWSELGVLYFFTSLLYLLIVNPVISGSSPIVSNSILVAPYIIFSIYYQGRVVKQWCPLCLIILSIISVQFFTSVLTVTNYTLSWGDYGSFSVIGLFLLVLGINLKKITLQASRGFHYERKYIQLKSHPAVFDSFAENKSKVNLGALQKKGIVLGNISATNHILMVCSPFCSPCADAHKKLSVLLGNNSNLALQIIFITSNEINDPTTYPVRHFLYAYKELGLKKAEELLHAWYQNKYQSYESFAKSFPVSQTLPDYREEIRLMQDWIKVNQIEYTPTLFLNGKEIPLEYGIEELSYVINDD